MVDVRKSKASGASGTGEEPTRQAAGGVAERTVFSLSEQETAEFGRSFGARLRGGELILLEGELGAGKTVFARGLAMGLGIAADSVSSPSYTVIHEYRGGRVTLYHVDLYRMSSVEELATLGLEELLGSGGVVAVEWGERLPPFQRRSALTVRMQDIGEGSRRIELLPARAEGEGQPLADA